MDTEPTLPPIRADLGAVRRRAVRHELLELLVLRHRAVVAGVAGTVVLGLVATLVAPGVLPSTALSGLIVGFVALVVGLVVGLVVHRRDPVLRAPGQARWDGSSVLAWVPSLADERELAPAVDVLRARLAAGGTQRLLVVEGGGDARGAAAMLGEAAAVGGIRSLVVDLTDTRPQAGMAAVGDGTVRLADAVDMAESIKLARIGAGRRVADSVAATVHMLARPSRDLELAIVVAPHDGAMRLPLVPAVDRVVLVVQAGARERTAVRDRLAQFHDGVPAELLLVGGHLTDGAMARADAPPAPDDNGAADSSETAPAGPPPAEVGLAGRQRVVVPPPTPPVVPPTDQTADEADDDTADDTVEGTIGETVRETGVDHNDGRDAGAVQVQGSTAADATDDRPGGPGTEVEVDGVTDTDDPSSPTARNGSGAGGGGSPDQRMTDDVGRAAAAVDEPLTAPQVSEDPAATQDDRDGPRAVTTLDMVGDGATDNAVADDEPVDAEDTSWRWGAPANGEHGPAAAAVTIDIDPDATADLGHDRHDEVDDDPAPAVGEADPAVGPGHDDEGCGHEGATDSDQHVGDVGRSTVRGTIDLAEPRDLVTSATLELLASTEHDERG